MYQKHNKEEVLRKGVELFWSNGFHNLGVDEICRSTGMTKGAFYNAFKSKENFLIATISTYGLMIVSHLSENLNQSKLKAFDRLHYLYCDMLQTQPKNNYMGCMVNNLMSELGSSNQLVAEATAIQFDHFLNAIEPTVQEAQQQGELDNTIDSRLLTELLHTTFFGLLTRSKSNKGTNHETMSILLHSFKK